MKSDTFKYLTRNERKALEGLNNKLISILDSNHFKIILFGSKARGDFDLESDLDLAVIIEKLDQSIKRKIIDIIINIELQFETTISSFIITAEEFEALKKRERRIALDIEQEGIIL